MVDDHPRTPVANPSASADPRVVHAEARMHAVLDQAPGACFEADESGRFVFVNRAWSALVGREPDWSLGEGWLDAVHPEDRSRVAGAWQTAIERRSAFWMDFRILTPANDVVWVAGSAGPVQVDGEATAGHLGWVTDITDRVNLEQYLEQALIDQVRITERLRREEQMHHALDQQFRAVFDRAPLGISIVGFDTNFAQVNQALCDLTGFSEEELIGSPSQDLLHPDDRTRAHREVTERLFVDRVPHLALEQRLVRADGHTRWVLSDLSLVRDDDDQPLYILTISIDITDRKLFEERLAHEASHDPLTGLPNRSLMRELLEQTMARARRRDTTMAIMFVDLDYFKRVNDEHGHHVGDEVLEQVAARLRNTLRLGDVVARYGGDEFVVLCDELGGDNGAQIVADRICDAMTSQFRVGRASVRIGASIGVALSNGDEDPDDLLQRADRALYAAKDRGRGTFTVADAARRG